ncbi:hypothetical protein FCM35_KLT03396 [Carex littledalei]|uniref:Uncharacterized protein n=1 Tax=Carex littledalei TaxID=544730 RepID=A0A833QSZ0_9POAL|nr:hypothetical protein FCM35_KLT03396 [Carex littledalei]
MKHCQAKRKMKVPRTSNSMDPVYKIFLDHVRLDGTSYILQMDDTEYGVPVYLKYEGIKTASSYYKHKTKPLKKAKNKGSDHIAPPSPSEESYERFLKHLTFGEGLMMLELERGRKVIYEEQRKNMSAILTQQNGMRSDEQGLVPYNGASGSHGEKNGLAVISANLQSFDEKLTAVLREPFDQHEYEALMNEAVSRKPVMKHRNLRNMSKRYHTHEAGQSYLDYYPDLTIQISEANKYERLNLLRKFFFWLENLCHDGAYMPWVPKTLADRPVFYEEFEN